MSKGFKILLIFFVIVVAVITIMVVLTKQSLRNIEADKTKDVTSIPDDYKRIFFKPDSLEFLYGSINKYRSANVVIDYNNRYIMEVYKININNLTLDNRHLFVDHKDVNRILDGSYYSVKDGEPFVCKYRMAEPEKIEGIYLSFSDKNAKTIYSSDSLISYRTNLKSASLRYAPNGKKQVIIQSVDEDHPIPAEISFRKAPDALFLCVITAKQPDGKLPLGITKEIIKN